MAKATTVAQIRAQQKKEVDTEIEFRPEELEFLLSLIAKSTFEGKDVQIVYETAVKIQKLIKPKV